MTRRAVRGAAYLLVAVAMMLIGPSCRRFRQLERVMVWLNRPHSIVWSGFYAAQEGGIYADEGLEVLLVPGDASPIEEVLSGKAMFGVGSGVDLMLARAEGKPVVAVMAVMRQNPLAVLSFAESGIVHPEDLKDRRVGLASSNPVDSRNIQFAAMLARAGVPVRRLEQVVVGEDGLRPLLSRQVEAIAYAWATHERVEAEGMGREPSLIFMSSYGVLEYPNVIFTTQEIVEQRPELVARLVQATLRGYRRVIAHPDEMVRLTSARAETLATGAQAGEEARLLAFFIDPGGNLAMGVMDYKVWESTQDFLVLLGWMERERAMLREIYTNQFVEK